jgi:hypothetical protein
MTFWSLTRQHRSDGDVPTHIDLLFNSRLFNLRIKFWAKHENCKDFFLVSITHVVCYISSRIFSFFFMLDKIAIMLTF